jgi:ribosomal protein L34
VAVSPLPDGWHPPGLREYAREQGWIPEAATVSGRAVLQGRRVILLSPGGSGPVLDIDVGPAGCTVRMVSGGTGTALTATRQDLARVALALVVLLMEAP